MAKGATAVLTEGAFRGPYPERADPPLGKLDQLAQRVSAPVARRLRARAFPWDRFVARVAEHGRAAAGLDDAGLRAAADDVRLALRRDGFADEPAARAFALVREVATRTIGQRHFDVQLIGGRVLLEGMVAEMETGEGKTLTATLPACAAALAGIPVHIVTVNDYLASRDAEWMGPIYRGLGISVGVIVHGLDPGARRAAYACDVTYCTNKEVTFDYLRDRIVLGQRTTRVHLQLERMYGEGPRLHRLLLRGLHFGIVDEADSVLVDEAKTPLIISGPGGDHLERDVYRQALGLAAGLRPDEEFAIEGRERAVRLTARGQARLGEAARAMGGLWMGRQRREELVRQAITAQHLFQRDKHYLVQDGKVAIIDEYTGRLMPDRSWEHGLHQMIEAKEDTPLTNQTDPLARISYQRFFRRYLRLAGMTGTAREVSGELWSVYGLAVVRIPTNRPVRRRPAGDHVYATAQEKWNAIVARIEEVHRAGRPILVGTRSVAASEHLDELLRAAELPHVVLNARQDKAEADIVVRAGEPGRITVATNMAGRGTDIRLAPGVVERGGLHVIATERHEAGRIDRQLFGRCGRQGDPGTFEMFASLEDDLATVYVTRQGRWLRAAMSRAAPPMAAGLRTWTVRAAQRAAQRLHSRMRRDLMKMDENLESALAFSGRGE